MVDWIAHLLVPWIGSKLLQLRFANLHNREIPIIMLGAVLPDLIAINYLLPWLGINAGGFLLPLHTPIGSLIVAALVSLMFSRRSRVFYLITVGVATHFALDALLVHAGGGMVLLFPFNWTWGFQLGLIQSDSWVPALASASVALLLTFALKANRRDKPLV